MGSSPETPTPPAPPERPWVRRARAAALASILIAFLGTLAGLTVQFQGVGHGGLLGGLVFALVATPFAVLVAVLLNVSALLDLRSKPEKLRPGRAAAAGWAGFAAALLIGLAELHLMNAYNDWEEWELAALSIPFALAQLALALCATKAYRSMTPGPTQKLWRAIRDRVAMAVLFGLLAVLSVSTWRHVWHTHPAGDGPTPMGDLRTINTALVTYASNYGKGYPTSLKTLGPPAKGAQESCLAAGLIWERLAGGLRPGYRIEYKPGTPHKPEKGEPTPSAAGCPEGVDTYTITANRVKSHKYDWTRNYFTDQSGVIRATDENRPATANDPPI